MGLNPGNLAFAAGHVLLGSFLRISRGILEERAPCAYIYMCLDFYIYIYIHTYGIFDPRTL